MSCGSLGNMGVLGRGCLGCPGTGFGLSSSHCFSASFVPCAASPPQLFPQLRSGSRCLCCGARLAVQRCHRTGISRSGLLQQAVCDSESHGRLAPRHLSFAPQPLCLPHPVLYGNFGVCPPIAPPRSLDGFVRSTRCLPPGPCPSGLEEVSTLLCGFRGFPVQSPLFWAFFGAASLHPGHGSGLFHCASVWVLDPPLSRRLVRPRILVPGDLAGEGLPSLALRPVGYSRQPRQEYPHTVATDRLSRHGPPVEPFEGLPDTNSCPESAWARHRIRVLSEAAARSLAFSSWGHVLSLHVVPGSSLRMRSLQLRLLIAGPLPSEDVLISWDDSCLQDLRWWSEAAHLELGVPLDLPHPDLILYTDASDSGWGASLGSKHLSGLWSQNCPLFSINHRELLAIFSAVDWFLPLLRRQSAALFTDNSTALSYLRKEGGTRSATLNAVAQAILRLCEVHSIRLLPQFIPGKLDVLADSLSRSSQVLGSEWTLCRELCQELFRLWAVTVDLFATSLNNRLQVYFSPVVDPQAAGTDAMVQPWDHLQAYAFPTFGLIPCLLAKVRLSRSLEMTLVAPFWPLKPWFPDLLELLVEVPVLLPSLRDLLRSRISTTFI